MTKKKRNILFSILFLFILIGGGTSYYIISILSTGFNIKEPVYIYVGEPRNYDHVLSQIEGTAHVKSIANFNKLASFMDYPANVKTGKYLITPDMNIKDVIRILKSGQQMPVQLKFNNIRTKEDLAKRISEQLMFSEKDLLKELNDSLIAKSYGFTTETFIAMFIPNTYEVYWDIQPSKFLKKMNTEYKKFWTDDRLKKAENIGITPIEVSTLASIVEEECYFSDEYPVVAGLYLNRLKIGQLLQADPTVKFAVADFSLQRILNKHLEVESPYNTYKHAGLPPGPIRIPSIKGIDAVLNPAQHKYYYMCAKEDFTGRHNFASSHAEHERNASRYRNALNKRKIY